MIPSSSCLNRLRNANRNSPFMSRNLTLQADTSRQTRRHGVDDTGNRELRSEARTSASISHPERPGQGNVRQHPVVGGVSRADSPSSMGTPTGAILNAPTDGSFSVGWKVGHSTRAESVIQASSRAETSRISRRKRHINNWEVCDDCIAGNRHPVASDTIDLLWSFCLDLQINDARFQPPFCSESRPDFRPVRP